MGPLGPSFDKEASASKCSKCSPRRCTKVSPPSPPYTITAHTHTHVAHRWRGGHSWTAPACVHRAQLARRGEQALHLRRGRAAELRRRAAGRARGGACEGGGGRHGEAGPRKEPLRLRELEPRLAHCAPADPVPGPAPAPVLVPVPGPGPAPAPTAAHPPSPVAAASGPPAPSPLQLPPHDPAATHLVAPGPVMAAHARRLVGASASATRDCA